MIKKGERWNEWVNQNSLQRIQRKLGISENEAKDMIK